MGKKIRVRLSLSEHSRLHILNILFRIFIISAAIAFIILLRDGNSISQPTLNIDLTADRPGITQFFSPDRSGVVSEINSTQYPLTIGENHLSLHVPFATKWIRWDPTNGEGDFEIKRIYLKVVGIKIEIDNKSLSNLSEIKEIQINEHTTHLQTTPHSTDPNLHINIPWRPVIFLQILFYLSLVIFLYLATGYILAARRSYWNIFTLKTPPTYIAIFAALCLFVTYKVTGIIPVGNGTGWDGGRYLTYIQSLGIGELIHNDPYRTIRMGAFIPAIIAATLGVTRDTLISYQIAINILTLSFSMAFFYDFLRHQSIDTKTAMLSSATLFFSWPVLVLPVYYPLLSDHIAIAITCLCLWLWGKGSLRGLLILCLWTPWVMPGLMLVPWVLAAIPKSSNSERFSDIVKLCSWQHWFFYGAIFILLATLALIVSDSYLNSFTIEAIINHPANYGPTAVAAIPTLRFWSTMATYIAIIAVCLLWTTLLVDQSLFKAIRFLPLAISTIVIIASNLMVFYIFQIGNDFKGPPIIENMFLQSLSAPFKPIVAHVLYFGPIFLVSTLAFCSNGRMRWKLPISLLVLLAIFFSFLAFGSESRQWIAAFPILVAAVAFIRIPIGIRIACLIGGLILCTPLYQLSQAIPIAYLQHENFMSQNWQLYFGRQGPWISPDNYILGLLFSGAFSMCCCSIVIKALLHKTNSTS